MMLFAATVEQQGYEFIGHEKAAIVATMDNKDPYLSIMPYVLDKDGNPVVLISDLAEHTQNIKDNPKACFCMAKPDKEGSIFNGSRATLRGKMVKILNDQAKEVRKTYLAAFPEAKDWVDFGDFNFYKLEVDSIYFIGGFGKIDYLNMDKYRKIANKHEHKQNPE